MIHLITLNSGFVEREGSVSSPFFFLKMIYLKMIHDIHLKDVFETNSLNWQFCSARKNLTAVIYCAYYAF